MNIERKLFSMDLLTFDRTQSETRLREACLHETLGRAGASKLSTRVIAISLPAGISILTQMDVFLAVGVRAWDLFDHKRSYSAYNSFGLKPFITNHYLSTT